MGIGSFIKTWVFVRPSVGQFFFCCLHRHSSCECHPNRANGVTKRIFTFFIVKTCFFLLCLENLANIQNSLFSRSFLTTKGPYSFRASGSVLICKAKKSQLRYRILFFFPSPPLLHRNPMFSLFLSASSSLKRCYFPYFSENCTPGEKKAFFFWFHKAQLFSLHDVQKKPIRGLLEQNAAKKKKKKIREMKTHPPHTHTSWGGEKKLIVLQQ